MMISSITQRVVGIDLFVIFGYFLGVLVDLQEGFVPKVAAFAEALASLLQE